MSKYKTDVSKKVIKEAEKITKATQRPGQTKEQTKLIAQGIQKGIEQYKKQYKIKARELDKKLKSINKNQIKNDTNTMPVDDVKPSNKSEKLSWILLIISWIGFLAYSL